MTWIIKVWKFNTLVIQTSPNCRFSSKSNSTKYMKLSSYIESRRKKQEYFYGTHTSHTYPKAPCFIHFQVFQTIFSKRKKSSWEAFGDIGVFGKVIGNYHWRTVYLFNCIPNKINSCHPFQSNLLTLMCDVNKIEQSLYEISIKCWQPWKLM